MATICRPGRATPAHVIAQEDLLEALRARYADLDMLEKKVRLIRHTTVKQRYFITPLERLFSHGGIASRVEDYIREGTSLAVKAITQALVNAQVSPADIGYFVLTSCTMPAVILPGLDAYIVNHMGLPHAVRRLPIAQMGCQAGATALAQAHHYLLGHPNENALVCALELCSLNVQPDDTDDSAFVTMGLFGDGCYATVVRGDDREAGLHILDTSQYLVPDTLSDMMYWNDERGNHFDTKREVVPGLKRGFHAIHTFLTTCHCPPSDLSFLVSHTGGPRVMNAVIEGLGVEERLIAASRESLREVGNISSASVLDVLTRTFDTYRPYQEQRGLLLGFGPGSTIEMLLGTWQESERK